VPSPSKLTQPRVVARPAAGLRPRVARSARKAQPVVPPPPAKLRALAPRTLTEEGLPKKVEREEESWREKDPKPKIRPLPLASVGPSPARAAARAAARPAFRSHTGGSVSAETPSVNCSAPIAVAPSPSPHRHRHRLARSLTRISRRATAKRSALRLLSTFQLKRQVLGCCLGHPFVCRALACTFGPRAHACIFGPGPVTAAPTMFQLKRQVLSDDGRSCVKLAERQRAPPAAATNEVRRAWLTAGARSPGASARKTSLGL
jgi:hypothetical protein